MTVGSHWLAGISAPPPRLKMKPRSNGACRRSLACRCSSSRHVGDGVGAAAGGGPFHVVAVAVLEAVQLNVATVTGRCNQTARRRRRARQLTY
jgi:hypothetical protein